MPTRSITLIATKTATTALLMKASQTRANKKVWYSLTKYNKSQTPIKRVEAVR